MKDPTPSGATSRLSPAPGDRASTGEGAITRARVLPKSIFLGKHFLWENGILWRGSRLIVVAACFIRGSGLGFRVRYKVEGKGDGSGQLRALDACERLNGPMRHCGDRALRG